MVVSLLIPETLIDRLATAPGEIARVTADVTPDRHHVPPRPGEWSAIEILGHLRACGDVWGRAIARIIAEDDPTIRAVSPRTWIDTNDDAQIDLATSLRAYAVQRAELVATLRSLRPADWDRLATVIGGGRPLRKTVHAYADRLARHERPHIQQIARAAVGR
jgi:DinB superfamily